MNNPNLMGRTLFSTSLRVEWLHTFLKILEGFIFPIYYLLSLYVSMDSWMSILSFVLQSSIALFILLPKIYVPVLEIRSSFGWLLCPFKYIFRSCVCLSVCLSVSLLCFVF